MTAALLDGLAQFGWGCLWGALAWCIVGPWAVRRERRLANARELRRIEARLAQVRAGRERGRR